ncbi:MAG: ribosome biogenesis GTP-binding protein YihA/YsxC [Burkholderiales bacterium]|nr:ribosome biogenesis GTP-binding protein YihA/YsxC [Burkholderiales bacterium]
MTFLESARFLRSAHDLGDLPPAGPPEVAFAGRSNAGKSSALNALARQPGLAHVSKTPGRTQLINFFRLAAGGLLVDLPGYGFARVPEALRRHWARVLSEYLQTRESLCGLVLVMDIRHPLTALDQAMLRWFRPAGSPILVLLAKADKLSRSAAQRTLHEVRGRLAEIAPMASVQLFSALKRIGVEDADRTISAWLGAVPAAPAGPDTDVAMHASGELPSKDRRGSGRKNKKAPSQRGKLGAKRLK